MWQFVTYTKKVLMPWTGRNSARILSLPMIEDVMCLEPLDELIMLTLLWTLGQNDPCSLYIYIKNRIFFHITAFKMSFTPISNKIDYLTTYSELWTFYSISPHL